MKPESAFGCDSTPIAVTPLQDSVASPLLGFAGLVPANDAFASESASLVALRGLAAAYNPSAAGKSPTILRLEKADPKQLAQALTRAAAQLSVGDSLILDIPGRTSCGGSGVTRDQLGCALFKAGFGNSLTWAGRAVLRAEARRMKWLAAFLPNSALGAGHSDPDDVSNKILPPADRIFCLARRSQWASATERRIKLSVVLPVYNEKSTFRDVMDQLLAKEMDGVDIEICLVESNSTDGTRDDVLTFKDHPRIKLLLEDAPRGKGHAVRAGLAMASGDIVLIQDADLEYDLADYERLIAPIRACETSFVLGARHHASERQEWKLRHFEDAARLSSLLNYGHLFFTWFLNVIFFQRLRDPFTMYKVFRRDCIYALRFECNRFDFDHELVGKLIRNGYPPTEIDVTYKSRSFDEGKKISIMGDPPTWICACVKHRFSRLREWPPAATAVIMAETERSATE